MIEYGTLTGTTTPSQSEPESNGNEVILHNSLMSNSSIRHQGIVEYHR